MLVGNVQFLGFLFRIVSFLKGSLETSQQNLKGLSITFGVMIHKYIYDSYCEWPYRPICYFSPGDGDNYNICWEGMCHSWGAFLDRKLILGCHFGKTTT